MQAVRVRMLAVTAATVIVVASCGAPAGRAGSVTTPSASTSAGSVAKVTPEADAVEGAAPVAPNPRVGAVFLGGGTADSVHTCSAAVLDSSTSDLILTAAHCVADSIGATFIPGFHDGNDDIWRITTVYLDPRWVASQDPHADFAIARVRHDAAADTGSVQSSAGGGLTLGSTPPAGTSVMVTGYPMGSGGDPLGCRGVTGLSDDGYPSLPCIGLTDGFSGAPWVVGSTVIGLIGGPDGGGCDDDLSFSPRFDNSVLELLARAEAGGAGDSAPSTYDSDC
ncbi:serine protease [Mycobacterium sp. 155]|uniref:trypsin-like serine peptidase n=1 Tax=Mycobacterium sp. 155 TaxID=1157943 RepID=UPI00056234FD|nr:trypsin-like peptidase domain-containing protein [Mycobacterium sp. 155]